MFLMLINNIQSKSFLSILVASFLGAFFAYLFNVSLNKRKQSKINANTLLECEYYLESLMNHQKQISNHINASMSHNCEMTKNETECFLDDFWLAVTPFYVTFKLPDLSTLSLSFLLKTNGEKYLNWILRQNSAHVSVCNLLDLRNQMDSGIMNKRAAKSVSASDGCCINEINSLTRELVKQNKNAIEDYDETKDDFSKFIQEYLSTKKLFKRLGRFFNKL